ncbi:MAG: 50S ribosomal protein L25 [Candidatus Omnitrophica bacterium]|nr:50S ribosomal protein L25 [Candidatus Omnitrophota bacterium]
MEEIKLDVQIRKEIGKKGVKAVRRNEEIPAIVYGGDQDPDVVKMSRRAFERILRQHKGQSLLFRLNIFENDNKMKDYSVIIKDEQLDPVSDKVIHVDFKRISLKEEIDVEVSIVSKGEPAGVKQDGGSLDHLIWNLDITCLPTNIPQKVEVDVSHLQIGDVIYVKDIELPEGVKTKHDGEDIVFSVGALQEEKPETGDEEPTEPEVLKEKKDKSAE